MKETHGTVNTIIDWRDGGLHFKCFATILLFKDLKSYDPTLHPSVQG